MLYNLLKIKYSTPIINALDIETFVDENNKLVPFCICFSIEGRSYTYYYSSNISNIIFDAFNFILKNFNKKTIYIHNINFDGFIIIENLSDKDIKIESLLRDMNMYWLKLYKYNNYVELRCSYKLIPNSLKDISKNFNVGEKDIFPHKFSKRENLFFIGEVPNENYFSNFNDYLEFKSKNNFFDFKKISIKYCQNDVQVTINFMEKLKNLLCSFDINLKECYSAPSLALKIFIKNFNQKRLSFNLTTKIDSIIRKSYFGGRCEVYGNAYDNEKVFYYDFSGMYGQCMLENFPFGKIKIEENLNKIDEPGFYFIEYYSNINIPVLPHKSYINEKLLFTNGENSGLFWFEEILLFIENGGIVNKIKFAIKFSKFEKIFEDYVNFFTKMRSISSVHKNFSKLMVNSLYGRMGMDFLENDTILLNEKDFLNYNNKEKIKKFKKINSIIIMEIENNFRKKLKSNVIIASCITSKARIKLYKAQLDVINNGGRILYSDTDSIFASYKKDVSNEIHGIVDWSKENKKIIDSVFISSKTYGLKFYNDKEIKVKGFNLNKIDFDELKNKFYNNGYIENKEKFLDRKNIEIILKYGNKKLDLSLYDKRIFDKNKKETRALFRVEDYLYK